MTRRGLAVIAALAILVVVLAAGSLMAGKVWAPFSAWTAGASPVFW